MKTTPTPDTNPEQPWAADFDALALLGYRYYTHGLYAEAARLFEFVLRHDIGNGLYHCALGKALHAQGEHEKALQSYRRALTLGMDSAEIHFCIGQCELYLNHIEGAGAALSTSLQHLQQTPTRPDGLAERVQHLLSLVHRHQTRTP